MISTLPLPLLAAAMEGAPVGLLLLAPDARPLLLNAEARRLLGIAPDRPLCDLDLASAFGALEPRALEDPPRSRPSARLLSGEEAPPVRVRVRARHVAGEERVLHVEANALRDVEGQLLGVIELFRDVTAEVAAGEHLAAARASAASQAELLSLASHDLRNPLGVVTLNAELLEQTVQGTDRPARLVAGLRRAAAQLNRIVADLLDVAALDAGQLRLVRADVEVGALLHELVEQERERAANAGISLVTRIEATSPLHADRDRLLQLLRTLLERAVAQAPAGSVVELAARAAGDGLELTISDRGPAGADEGPRVERAPGAAERRRAGLDLAVARGLVEAHGGTLAWEPREGGGSTWWIRLGP